MLNDEYQSMSANAIAHEARMASAAKSVREDPEVEQWFSDKRQMALLLVKRPTASGGTVE